MPVWILAMDNSRFVLIVFPTNAAVQASGTNSLVVEHLLAIPRSFLQYKQCLDQCDRV
jgi:hypothetical protein